MSQSSKMVCVDGHSLGIKGDIETSPKEDILWMLESANDRLSAGDTIRVKQLLNSIRLLVTHNMENT